MRFRDNSLRPFLLSLSLLLLAVVPPNGWPVGTKRNGDEAGPFRPTTCGSFQRRHYHNLSVKSPVGHRPSLARARMVGHSQVGQKTGFEETIFRCHLDV
jgi:hypothetical protein